MSYIVSTDSCCDLTQSYLDKRDIKTISLSYTMEGKEYMDDFGASMGSEEFFMRVKAGAMPTTSLINAQSFLDLYNPILADGTDVLHLSFSSALSGSYQNCVIAMDELKGKYPDRKIIVVDTKCASMGQGLFVHMALNKRDEGLSIEELAKWAEDNKGSICQWFTADDLRHLFRGGRLSRTAAIAGTLLSIKPVMHVDDEGALKAVHKIKGRKKALKTLVDMMEESAIDPAGQTIFITHGDCLADAENLAGLVKERLGTKDFVINFMGPVIGAHGGPGTLAIAFIGNKR